MLLFADLSLEELSRAAELTDWIEIPAGETVGAERNFAYEFFVSRTDGRRSSETAAAWRSSAQATSSARSGSS